MHLKQQDNDKVSIQFYCRTRKNRIHHFILIPNLIQKISNHNLIKTLLINGPSFPLSRTLDFKMIPKLSFSSIS